MKYLEEGLSDELKTELHEQLKQFEEPELVKIVLFAEFAPEELWREVVLELEKIQLEASKVQHIAILKKKKLRRLRITAAAALIIAGVMALLLSIYKSVERNGVPIVSGVILELDDGRQVSLDTIAITELPDQGGYKLFVGKGMLRYVRKQNGPYYKGRPVFNWIYVPQGKQYMVKLPDESTVCLNEYSSIRYFFCDSIRHRSISMRGEACFNIKPMVLDNKKVPFTVDVKTDIGLHQKITVLGTTFNVNAYSYSPIIKTSLFEGSVKVESGGKTVSMKPGEAAMVSKREINVSKEEDVKDAIAWKNDSFYFSYVPIKNVLRELELWYGQPIEYKGDKQSKVSMMLPRSMDYESLIRGFAKDGNCTFRKKGNVIQVVQKN